MPRILKNVLLPVAIIAAAAALALAMVNSREQLPKREAAAEVPDEQPAEISEETGSGDAEGGEEVAAAAVEDDASDES